jgi:NitT/TauT family transport system substrate-binding protein
VRRATRLIGAVVAAAALIVTAGCTGDDASGDDTQAKPGGALEKVTYLTGVNIQGRESYIYVAQEKGYFKDAGLEVEVKPGLGSEKNLQLLQAGQVDFAMVDISAGLIAYGQGKFKDFTIVSAVHQRNLACFMALSGSGITTPKDLENKRIAFIPGGIVYTLFNTYAKLAGINPATVKWVNMPPQDMGKGMATGQIDAATQFVVGKPAVEQAAKATGKTAVVLPFSDQLVDLYGNGLAVSKKSLADNPDRVRRFNEAMLKGLKYAIENPAEAGKIYAKFQKLQPEPVAAAEVSLMVPYVKPASGAIGSLEEQKVTRNIALLQGAGAIPGPINAKDIISFDYVAKG